MQLKIIPQPCEYGMILNTIAARSHNSKTHKNHLFLILMNLKQQMCFIFNKMHLKTWIYFLKMFVFWTFFFPSFEIKQRCKIGTLATGKVSGARVKVLRKIEVGQAQFWWQNFEIGSHVRLTNTFSTSFFVISFIFTLMPVSTERAPQKYFLFSGVFDLFPKEFCTWDG